MNGIINFFKPRGMTSHGAVNFLRRKLNTKRIGHTGTLDPSVSGVLPLCIGKATRVSEYLLDSDKEYIGELTLGIKTDSQDMDGRAIAYSNKYVGEEEIRAAFAKFKGNLKQLPPMHSAIRHQGKRLYELAREGKEVSRKLRDINIYENEILNIEGNKILFRIRCSKGSYIRTVCNDIGEYLGTYGYMSYLIRTETDIFRINNALGKETIENMSIEEIQTHLLPMDLGARSLEKIVFPKEYYLKLSHGVQLELGDEFCKYKLDTEYRIYCQDEFIGIGVILEKQGSLFLRMRKVLLT